MEAPARREPLLPCASASKAPKGRCPPRNASSSSRAAHCEQPAHSPSPRATVVCVRSRLRWGIAGPCCHQKGPAPRGFLKGDGWAWPRHCAKAFPRAPRRGPPHPAPPSSPACELAPLLPAPPGAFSKDLPPGLCGKSPQPTRQGYPAATTGTAESAPFFGIPTMSSRHRPPCLLALLLPPRRGCPQTWGWGAGSILRRRKLSYGGPCGARCGNARARARSSGERHLGFDWAHQRPPLRRCLA
mmetsp:Transcript_120577/g.269540  ORF Transcript_120577/g.269540 Transcript_120577/m.269540 type:complete len:243 (-) Transcript_120577:114-842(-)